MLVAIDPSIERAGVALFLGGRLVFAECVKSDMKPSDDIGARCYRMAQLIHDRIPDSPDQVAIEWPQVYRGHKSEGDPASLFGLAGVGCAVVALLSPREVLSYLPSEWAGQLKKVKSGDCKASPRALRIESRLTGSEKAVWQGLRRTDHDAIDAIGIGLHALDRLKRRRVYAGASV